MRFGPISAAEIRWKRVGSDAVLPLAPAPHEVSEKINGVQHTSGERWTTEEGLEPYVSKMRDKKAALKFLMRADKEARPT